MFKSDSLLGVAILCAPASSGLRVAKSARAAIIFGCHVSHLSMVSRVVRRGW